jgi:hypothetical protein
MGWRLKERRFGASVACFLFNCVNPEPHFLVTPACAAASSTESPTYLNLTK